MRAVSLFYPAVAAPARYYFPQTSLAAESALKCSQVVHSEQWCQLVEHRVIATVTDALVACINKLTLECLAKCLYLLRQAVLGHHSCKVQTGLALLGVAGQHVEDYTAAESDDGGTLAIGVLHVVDVFGSLYSLLLYPLLDGSAQTGSVYQSAV